MEITQALANLAKEHAQGNIFVVGEAIKASAHLHTRASWEHTGTPEYPQMKEDIEGIWRSYSHVSQMYYLHLEQEFDKYYRSLPWWRKRRAHREQHQWMAERHTQLKDEADTLVNAILDAP